MTVIGTAEVRVVPDAKGFGPALVQQVEKPTKDVFTRIGGFAAGAFAGRAAINFLADLGNAAGDAAETASKASVVFGSAADSVAEFAETAPTAIGLSSQAAQEAAGTYGNLFRAVGLAEGASAEMSTTLIQLAGDLASFNNADPTEVLEALRAGLVGETEPLRRFGININEATLRQEALNQGLEVGTGTLDSAVKAQAAYALIMQQTTLAQGDFVRTGDGLANQQRILAAEWENAKVQLGQGLAPVMLELVRIGRQDLIPSLLELGERAVPLLASSFSAAEPLLGSSLSLLVSLTPALSAVASVVDSIPEPLLQLAALSLVANQGIGRTVGGVSNLMGRLDQLATVVHKTPVPYDEWAASANRGGRAVGGLISNTQAAGLAAGLAVTAYSLWASELQRIEASAEALGDTVRSRLNEGLAETGDPVTFIGDKINQLDAEIAGLQDTIDGSSAPWDADFRRELAAGRDELERVRSELAEQQHVLYDLGQSYGITAQEAGQLAAAQGIDLSGSAEDVNAAFRDAYLASQDLEQQLGDTGDEALDTAEDLQAQIDALEELTQATLEAASSQLGYEGAAADTRDALGELTEAQTAMSDGVGTAAEDLANLEAAQRAAEQAALDQAEAALRLAEDTATARGETLTWEEKNRILREELGNVAATLDPGSPLRRRLDATIFSLASVPGTYAATVQVEATDASRRLQAIIDLMDAIARRSGLNVLLHGGGSINQRDHALGAAHGFAGTLTRPTRFTVAEGGEPEDVLVVPRSEGGLEAVLAGLGGVHQETRSGDRELIAALRSGRLGGSGVTLQVPPGAMRSDPVATAIALHGLMRRSNRRRQGSR